jgi:putative endonuclease
MRGSYVYILGSESGVLYTGVTNRLTRRTIEHRQELVEGFTKKYNVTRLVHWQRFSGIGVAIAREKKIKG